MIRSFLLIFFIAVTANAATKPIAITHVDDGLTPMQALQAATINSATVTNRSKELGSVDAGKFADLVLLNADPLADIHNASKIDAVIVAGKLLHRADLDALLREGERAAAGN